ncbi:MAG TPA: DUF6786 family protein [Acidobacteriota bacterium]|nr:DUF6786 family protein [Acidobacteriota bacterium]
MKMNRSIPALLGMLIGVLGCSQPAEQQMMGQFGKDLEFLKKHTDVVVLSSESAQSQVVVVPAWQGRVMTSTSGGLAGASYGWLNYELIESGVLQPHINAFGGEDRFWMGPEGGQYAIFFEAGAPFDLEAWQTPPLIDTDAFEITSRERTSVTFSKSATIQNYSDMSFDLRIERAVSLMDTPEVEAVLKVELPPEVGFVAFQSENSLFNRGTESWTKEKGLLSIWILGMYVPSPHTTVVIPFTSGPEAELGPIVNDAYFGKVPSERLVVSPEVIFFKADGEYRAKIGLSPMRAVEVLGSWDSGSKTLTVVQYSKPAGAVDYVNSMWEIQEAPYAGDVVNSYNDGPPEPGAKPLGPFYELETSSPAVELPAGEAIRHIHRTFHFSGPEQELDKLAKSVLGVSLSQIENAF